MNPNAQPGAPQAGASNQPPSGEVNYEQPVAYDAQGRPLYAHPPQQNQVMYLSRPFNPPEQKIPEEILKRSEESKKKYPHLNISKGEYVISAVRRHPIGLLLIWLLIIAIMAALGALYWLLFMQGDSASLGSLDTSTWEGTALAALGGMYMLILLGGFAASYIYNQNRFYLTNESVIQEIQTTLLSKHEQTVSLGSIEDASYKQNGLLPMMFNFGTIRLSTPGDETTYTFTYVANPKKHIATLNNAVEAFKNGRPLTEDGSY